MIAADEEPPHHHLPKMMDDDDEEEPPHYGNQSYPTPITNFPPPSFAQPPDHSPNYGPPPPTCTHNPSPRPHNTPPPPRQPTPPPPKRRSPTPPPLQSDQPKPRHRPSPPFPEILSPAPPLPPPQKRHPPPQKRHPPPPYTQYEDDDDYDNKDDNNNLRSQICGVLFILLLLVGLAALVLWLIYRPHKPKFAAVSAAVYSLNVTLPPFISASVQITVVTKNPNKRTTLYYDNLMVAVYYRNQAITPPLSLPPLVMRTRRAVMMSPAVGGGAPVTVGGEVVEGLAGDEAYGVVGLSWVMVGRVRYKAGWFKSSHGRVVVRCDVLVGLKHGTPGVLAGGVFSNPTGQVPLLANPPCLVDM